MKTSNRFLITIIFLLAFLFIGFEFYVFPFPFVIGNLESKYAMKNTGSDTTLRFQKFENILDYKVKSGALAMAGFPFTIDVTGSVDSNSEIYLKFVGYQGKVYSYLISKGKIDTTFCGELYEDEAEIVYLHKKAKSGNLKLAFRIGKNY